MNKYKDFPSPAPYGAGRVRAGAFTFIYFILVGLSHADAVPPQVCHLDDCVTVEAVSKQEDLERGLMYRVNLAPDKGMLFIFTNDDRQQFWMKNMHFSLDIVWISVDGRIVYIGRNIPACNAAPCPVYTPDQSARYVLELNSGYTAAHHWNLGDRINIKGLLGPQTAGHSQEPGN